MERNGSKIWLGIVLLSLCALLYYGPAAWATVLGAPDWWGRSALACLWLCLGCFVAFAVYQLVIGAATAWMAWVLAKNPALATG